MRDEEGSGIFVLEGLRDGAKYKHLVNGIVVTEDALEVSIFDTLCKIKKKWRRVF